MVHLHISHEIHEMRMNYYGYYELADEGEWKEKGRPLVRCKKTLESA